MPIKSMDVIKNNCKNTYDAAKETIAQIALEISGYPKCECNNNETIIQIHFGHLLMHKDLDRHIYDWSHYSNCWPK